MHGVTMKFIVNVSYSEHKNL